MEMNETNKMSLMEHLDELRQRIIKSLLALAVATAFCLIFTGRIFDLLLWPIRDITLPGVPVTTRIVLAEDATFPAFFTGSSPISAAGPYTVPLTLPAGTALTVKLTLPQSSIKPIFTRPTEMFLVYFKVTLIAGLCLAMPVIAYQAFRFLVPALTARERRYLFFFVPGATAFFLLGLAFAYFLMLPFALKYLFTFGGGIAQPLPSIGEYISFVTQILFWIGLVFETPLVVFFLAKLRLVTAAQLAGWRKYAVLVAFVVAAFVTPTPDPLNQFLVAVPIILLYEIGIWLAKLAR
jgi:sec-independent protein translocase protein TatC